ncbi:MAG: hypothetical protein IT432_08285 [Phycisphaerales bacterium]|nr:hypothetical protein [Phycisphaerales bacterium]
MLEYLFRAITEMEEANDAWDEACASIDSVSFAEETINVSVRIVVPGSDSDQEWRIVAPKPLDYRLTPYSGGGIYLDSDHVALWPYSKPRHSIYMTGRVLDPAPLLGRLLDAHRDLVGDWWPIDTFINHAFLTIISDHWNPAIGYFSLGGPEPLMLEYIKVLEQFGLKTSIPERSPHYGMGGNPLPSGVPAQPVYMLDIGGSYIIASQFHAERIS